MPSQSTGHAKDRRNMKASLPNCTQQRFIGRNNEIRWIVFASWCLITVPACPQAVDYNTLVRNPPGLMSDAQSNQFTSLAAACAAADSAGATLSVTRQWKALKTQTIGCKSLTMAPGGLIQPAAGQTITISGAFSSPETETLDTSLGAPGSIVFGSKSLVDETVIPHAEWFGASPSASGGTNTRALQSAAYAFPPSGYVRGPSGPVRAHQGAFTIGCGAFTVAGHLYLNTGHRFYSPCTTTSTLLSLAPNTFNGSEDWMIRVFPTCQDGIACRMPEANITQSVSIENVSLACNYKPSPVSSNTACSGILFYGAETSVLSKVNVGGFALRGISIGDYARTDTSINISDNIRLVDVWIDGDFAASGPGLYVRATNILMEDMNAQHVNSKGRYSGGCLPGQPNPGVCIDSGSSIINALNGHGEDDWRGWEIYNASNIHVDNWQPGTCGTANPLCENKQGDVAFRITGNSGNINIMGAQSYYATSVYDASTQYPSAVTIPGSPSGSPNVWYSSGYGAGVSAISLTNLRVLMAMTGGTVTSLGNLIEQAHNVVTTSTPSLSGAGCTGALLHDTAGIFSTAGADTCVLKFGTAMANPVPVATGKGSSGSVTIGIGAISSTAVTFVVSAAGTYYYHIDDVQ
jgi:hypothetical protein